MPSEMENKPFDAARTFSDSLASRKEEMAELPEEIALIAAAAGLTWDFTLQQVDDEDPDFEKLEDALDLLEATAPTENEEEAWSRWPIRLPFDIELEDLHKTAADLMLERFSATLPPDAIEAVQALMAAYDDAGVCELSNGKPSYRSLGTTEIVPLIAGFGAPAGQIIYSRLVKFRGIAIPLEAEDLGSFEPGHEAQWLENRATAMEMLSGPLAEQGLGFRSPQKGIEFAMSLLEAAAAEAEAEEEKKKQAQNRKKAPKKKQTGHQHKH